MGVFFIAFGEQYINEAVFCAKSIKENTNLPIAICCDEIKQNDKYLFKKIIYITPNHERSKVDFLEVTPFECSLYLDSDTQVLEDITPIFRILEKYDIAFTHDFSRKRFRWSKIIPEYENIPDGFSELGGGVMLYRKSKAIEFIDLWKNYFYKYYKLTNGWDQASLRIAAWESQCSLYVLPPEFNLRSLQNRKKTDSLVGKECDLHPLRPRIHHWHGLNDPNSKMISYKF